MPSQPKTPRQTLGRHGENLAAQYLQARGHQIIERNFRAGRGEIDLIAWPPADSRAHAPRSLIFFEVKTRRNLTFGHPEENLTPRQLNSLKKTALQFLVEHPELKKNATCFPLRFDIMAIELNADLSLRKIKHLKDVL